MTTQGHVDHDAAECVLAAAGHQARARPQTRPAGMTDREAEVLQLAATGLTTAQIARKLVISPRPPTATYSTSTPRSAAPPAAPPSCSHYATTWPANPDAAPLRGPEGRAVVRRRTRPHGTILGIALRTLTEKQNRRQSGTVRGVHRTTDHAVWLASG